MKKQEFRLERIKAVERQFDTARKAITTLRVNLRASPALLRELRLRVADLNNLEDELESTFLVKMFAEFESGLRDVWANARKRKTKPMTEVLINSLCVGWKSVSRPVPGDTVQGVHSVREYRNAIVHEGDGRRAVVTIKVARGHLCTFFSYMPLDW